MSHIFPFRCGVDGRGVTDLRESRLLDTSCSLARLWWERYPLCSWGAPDIRPVDVVGPSDVEQGVGFAND